MFTIRRLFFLALGLAPWVLLPGNAAATNLVTNGGFEINDACTQPTGGFCGWTVNDPSPISIDFTSLFPHSGNSAAILGTAGTDGTLSQTLTTLPGMLYDLEFWLANDNGISPFPNHFAVSWDNTPLYDVTNVDSFSYTYFKFSVIGTGSDTLLFAAQNDNGFFFLDDVSVQVPEPASALLAGLGGVLLGAMRRRPRPHRLT